jgi:hypothetical protein
MLALQIVNLLIRIQAKSYCNYYQSYGINDNYTSIRAVFIGQMLII